MVDCNFCSLILKKEVKCSKNNLNINDINLGRIDLKIMKDHILFHIFVFNLPVELRYDVYIILGENGKLGYQKAYIITNNYGRLNNTFKIDQKTSNFPLQYYKDLTCIALIPYDKNFNNIIAFKKNSFDYQNVIYKKNEPDICLSNNPKQTPNNNSNELNSTKIKPQECNVCKSSTKPQNKEINHDYKTNQIFENIISSGTPYWPFPKQQEGMKFTKINLDTFLKLKLNMRENLINFIKNNTKIYGYMIFGSFSKDDKILYMLGIPDKFDFQQSLAMANMGIYRFQSIDLKNLPQPGDLGFWTYHC